MIRIISILLAAVLIGCNGANLSNTKSEVHFAHTFLYADSTWKKDTVTVPISLDSSKAIWEKIKKEKGTNYLYTYCFASVFGYGERDVVLVTNDSVDEVIKTATHINQNNGSTVIDTQYLITKASDDIKWFKTVDGFYSYAENTIMTKDTAQNSIECTMDATGILSGAYYTPKECIDDCRIGYNVNGITFVEIQQ